MDAKDYWIECVCNAAEECGADLTQDQIECIAESVRIGHEDYGMAFYSPPISEHPVFSENERLIKELRAERNKVHCRQCNGRGRIISHFGVWSSDSQCWKCGGEGRHAP